MSFVYITKNCEFCISFITHRLTLKCRMTFRNALLRHYSNIKGKIYFDQTRDHPPWKNAFLLCIKFIVQNIVAFNHINHFKKRKTKKLMQIISKFQDLINILIKHFQMLPIIKLKRKLKPNLFFIINNQPRTISFYQPAPRKGLGLIYEVYPQILMSWWM